MARLKSMGATEVGTRWLANAIDFTVPARMAPILAAWPEIESLQHGTNGKALGAPNEGYWGIDRRTTFHADRILSNGFIGSKGNAASPTTPVRLGALMSTPVPKNHPGFKISGGGTRYYQYQQCNPNAPLSCFAGSDPTGSDHDTAVMTVMGGSIEGGQDPTFLARTPPRSGIAVVLPQDLSLNIFRRGRQRRSSVRPCDASRGSSGRRCAE